jgi:hypothetical protein
MPNQILPTSGPGTSNQWSFVGADTSWQAVARGSGDASYIETLVGAAASDFFCGSGTKASTGRIVGITLHYRIRPTVPLTGAFVLFSLFQAGVQQVVSPAVPVPSGWVVGEFRIRESWTTPGSRPGLQELADLGVGVSLLAAPASGTVQVSELWVEVETVATPYCYDPFDGALPEALVGPLQWTTIGTQPVSLTPDHYLVIADTSPADLRMYYQVIPDEIRSDYVQHRGPR